MVFLPLILGILLLLVLITFVKLDTFISFILVCIFVGLLRGLSLIEIMSAVQKGIGSTMGTLVIILGFGVMLGKLVAESGAADKITNDLIKLFGLKNIQWALITTGFIVGIPLFYTVGFVILVPLVIAIASKTKLPLLYVGLPMLASLSVTHGFLPPHPAPTAVADLYGADMGKTMIYGFVVGIPAILTAKFALAGTMQKIRPVPSKEFQIEPPDPRYKIPNLPLSLTIALLPVILIGGTSAIGMVAGKQPIIDAIGNPSVAMLISVLAAIYFLGIRTGRKMTQVTKALGESIAAIALVLLIISGAGAFKEIMTATGISDELGITLASLGLSPLVLAWFIAAIIRISVGSATVAALTTGSIMVPMLASSQVSPELLVLATGAGSIMLSHVNDGGFWLFKEYFNMSIKDTLRTWTLMETIVSIVGLLGVLLLNLFI